jgi:hypothetical protein
MSDNNNNLSDYIDLVIPRPSYDINYNFIDNDCLTIADYLYNEINKTFLTPLGRNIVTTYRTFNDVYIPNVDFPVLKVYKVNEQDNFNIGQFTDVTINISYILAYTKKDKIADVSSYVATEIKRLLKNADLIGMFQVNWEKPINTTYETMIDPSQLIYKYTNITFNLYTCPVTITTDYKEPSIMN